MVPKIPQFPSAPLSHEQLHAIVKSHLPAWLKACASDSDIIVIHEAAFDTSGSELFLFACALKYAGLAGKMVHITCGASPNLQVRGGLRAEIYRDQKRTANRMLAEKGKRKTSD